MTKRPWLRQVRHATLMRAVGRGAHRSGGGARAVDRDLDGDGQNDPKFIPQLLDELSAGAPRIGLVAGQRVGRKDTAASRNSSRGSPMRCAMRCCATARATPAAGSRRSARDVFLTLPYFDGLHRFLPALVRREGYDIGYVDVVDRPRHAGVSNYGMWDRLWVGILDLWRVWWLIRRKKRVPDVSEVR